MTLTKNKFLHSPLIVIVLILPLCTGCQLGYLVNSGYEQARIQWAAVDVETVLNDKDTPESLKNKLRLVAEVKNFAEQKLTIKPTPNFTTYLALNRPYVSYLLTASRKDELKPYEWHFPLFGSFPYLGFFDEERGKKEQSELEETGEYDTYMRGVRAYSTLGWLKDPILSSLTDAHEEQIVETVIHECIHAELWVPSSVSFNEQLAVFLADRGKELFYKIEKGDQERVQKIRKRREESSMFATFLQTELNNFENFLTLQRQKALSTKQLEELKKVQFLQIKERFKNLNLASYKWFESHDLNNASLVALRVYLEPQKKWASTYKQILSKHNDAENLGLRLFLDWIRGELSQGKSAKELI